jgi:hypothetical protein
MVAYFKPRLLKSAGGAFSASHLFSKIDKSVYSDDGEDDEEFSESSYQLIKTQPPSKTHQGFGGQSKN